MRPYNRTCITPTGEVVLFAPVDEPHRSKFLAMMNATTMKGRRSERMREARQKGTHTSEQWLKLLAEFEHRCVRCGEEGYVEKDHITPVSMGGSDAIENIQPLCSKCNGSKGRETFDWAGYRRRQGFTD